MKEDCDHRDIEKWICLTCGKDMTEEIMTEIYDRTKNLRKYGE